MHTNLLDRGHTHVGLEELVGLVAHTVTAMGLIFRAEILRQRGLWFDADPQDDRFALEQPGLSALSKASRAGTIGLGDRAGSRVMRVIGQCANDKSTASPPPMLGFSPSTPLRTGRSPRLRTVITNVFSIKK